MSHNVRQVVQWNLVLSEWEHPLVSGVGDLVLLPQSPHSLSDVLWLQGTLLPHGVTCLTGSFYHLTNVHLGRASKVGGNLEQWLLASPLSP